MTTPRLEVTYLNRPPSERAFSLERVFTDVRGALPDWVTVKALYCPWQSRGIVRRGLNILWARLHAGRLNHITGDVHYIAMLLRKRGLVLTIADCVPLEHSRNPKRALLWFFWYWLPIRRASVVTVISEFTKDNLLQHVKCSPSKIEVIHCPVSPSFRPKERPFNSGEPCLLHIGTGQNKNLPRVAEALRGLTCRLAIVGHLSPAQIECLERNGINYEPYEGLSDERLVQLYGQCDAVLFASLYEGFGLPIVEAQAVGRPVVTSNRCSMPEVAGGAACLVDPESPASIREGVVKILQDAGYRERLVSEGFRNVKRFAPEVIAGQYAELYQRVAAQ